jgi:2-isopropylmalate synthase
MEKNISMLDTSFRDGMQSSLVETAGLKKSLKALQLLDELGCFEYIEAGFAASNNGDSERIKEALKLNLHAKIAVFGWATPESAKQMIEIGVPVGVLVIKIRKSDVKTVLRRDPTDYIRIVNKSVKLLAASGIEVILDAEHAFQAIVEDDQSYALRLLRECHEAGAKWLVLCDTNGKTSLKLAKDAIRTAAKEVPIASLGVHFHNDRGRAVALSEMAYESGIRHIQGVFGGFGERTGNTDLSVLIPNLCQDHGSRIFPRIKLDKFTASYQNFCEMLNIRSDPCHPWVGRLAFYSKAGMHVAAENAVPGNYLHADPTIVGNRFFCGLSEISGKASLAIKAKEAGIEIPESRISEITARYKELADKGVSFERAEASFELWLLRELGSLNTPFLFKDWRIVDECLFGGQIKSEASLAMVVCDRECLFNARGEGPVNALENVLRRTLENNFPEIEQVKMSEFSFQTIDMKKGSAALVRIFCVFTDGCRNWTTVGVNEDFLWAAWQAILDGYLYRIASDS